MRYALLILILIPGLALAELEGRYEVTVKKHQEKKKARWTLEEWLAQKDRNRMMDLWLAQNSHSSPFEFFLEGRSLNYNLENSDRIKGNHNAFSGTLAAYAGLAGLRGGYEVDQEPRKRWCGSVNIRLLGRALQDTHINLEYGLQGLSQLDTNFVEQKYQNQFGKMSMDIYLTKYFGIDGYYRKILPGDSEKKRRLEGESFKGGVFIDFGPYRIFGEWQKENL